MTTDIDSVLAYWFGGPEPSKKWFQGGPAVDIECSTQFGLLVEKARASHLTSWTAEPQGTLALLILLDQFSRNIYRGTPAAFSSDQMAHSIATKAIAQGFDRKVEKSQMQFFYLPLMHSESLVSQVASVALYENLLARNSESKEDLAWFEMTVGFARSHLNCILRFGRFPSRNQILGRPSTQEEIEYLKEFPHGF